MRFAQIQNNRVHWVFEADEAPEFAEDIVIIDITDYPQVQEGWGFVDDEFIDPTPTFEELKAAKADEIAAERYVTANGHITVNGHTYNIDAESRLAFLGLAEAMGKGLLSVAQWKTQEGFVVLTVDDFNFVALVVFAYTEACFNAESVLQTQISAATSEADLNAIAWVAPDIADVIAGVERSQSSGE